jgi:hypothetical protein
MFSRSTLIQAPRILSLLLVPEPDGEADLVHEGHFTRCGSLPWCWNSNSARSTAAKSEPSGKSSRLTVYGMMAPGHRHRRVRSVGR